MQVSLSHLYSVFRTEFKSSVLCF